LSHLISSQTDLASVLECFNLPRANPYEPIVKLCSSMRYAKGYSNYSCELHYIAYENHVNPESYIRVVSMFI